MNTGLVPATGTDFGPPLRMALSKLEDQEGPSTNQNRKSSYWLVTAKTLARRPPRS
ncbi:MAG: hypothetical protein WDO15_11120 [Bacteroidota bacterium]